MVRIGEGDESRRNTLVKYRGGEEREGVGNRAIAWRPTGVF